MIDVVMAREIRVRRYGAQNLGVFYHGEKEALGNRSQHGVVYGKGLRSARERGRLQFALVKLNLAMAPLLRAVLCASRIAGLGLTRLTINWALRK